MNLASLAIEKRAVTYFTVLILFVGGIGSFMTLGWLEDPEFTVKTAAIVTPYPGASAKEVELEVTDRIEQAIQEMPQLKELYSISRAGLSIVRVDIKPAFTSKKLPQVWDEMRSKITDIKPLLPPGAGEPDIADDFGFVYGFLLAMTSSGFTDAELERYAKHLKKELSVVPGAGASAVTVVTVTLAETVNVAVKSPPAVPSPEGNAPLNSPSSALTPVDSRMTAGPSPASRTW